MTARPWRLTPAAEAALDDVARWTRATFGPRQAAAYAEDLLTVCERIAAGTAHTQDCRRLLHPNLPEDMRFARAGQHFVIFIDAPDQVIILSFVHSRANLPERLNDLQGKGH